MAQCHRVGRRNADRAGIPRSPSPSRVRFIRPFTVSDSDSEEESRGRKAGGEKRNEEREERRDERQWNGWDEVVSEGEDEAMDAEDGSEDESDEGFDGDDNESLADTLVGADEDDEDFVGFLDEEDDEENDDGRGGSLDDEDSDASSGNEAESDSDGGSDGSADRQQPLYRRAGARRAAKAKKKASYREQSLAKFFNKKQLAASYDSAADYMQQTPGVAPRQDGVSADEREAATLFWQAGSSSVVDTSMRNKSKSFVPPDAQARAQERLDAFKARQEHKRRQERKQGKQQAPQRRRKRRGARRSSYTDHSRGAPTFGKLSESSSLLARIVDALWALIQRQKGPNKIDGLRHENWQDKLTKKDLEGAVKVGFGGAATPIAREILKLLEQNPAQLLEEKWWDARMGQSLATLVGDNIRLRKRAPLPLGAGLYIGVVLRAGKVVGLYIGRTKCLTYRYVEHLCTIYFEKYKPRFQTIAQAAERVILFPLFEDASATRFSKASYEMRAILEGLWCMLLGTFRGNAAYLKIRRDHGNVDLGDSVAGLNSTPCCETPEKEKTHFRIKGRIRDVDCKTAADRIDVIEHDLLVAAAANDGLEHLRLTIMKQTAQHVLSLRLAELVVAPNWLRLAPPTREQSFVFCRFKPALEDARLMEERAQGGDWEVQLREVGSDADGSLPHVWAVDYAAFSKLQLVGRAASGTDKREVIFRKKTAPMAPSTRRFFDLMLSILPPARLALRRQAHRRAVDKVIADRPNDYNRLSKLTRMAVDGMCFIDDRGGVRLYDTLIHTIDKPTREMPAVRDLRDAAGLKHVDNKMGRVASSVPFRLCLGDGKSPAMRGKKAHVEGRWEMKLQPLGKYERQDEVNLPYLINADKRSTARQPQDILRDAFEDLDAIVGNAGPRGAAKPDIFLPQQKKMSRTGPGPKAGGILRLSRSTGKLRLFSLLISGKDMRSYLGGAWRKGETSRDIQYEIVGSGERYNRRLRLRIGLDKSALHDVTNMDDKRRQSGTNREVLVEYIEFCRLADEKSTGQPMIDLVRASEMTWEKPPKSARATVASSTSSVAGRAPATAAPSLRKDAQQASAGSSRKDAHQVSLPSLWRPQSAVPPPLPSAGPDPRADLVGDKGSANALTAGAAPPCASTPPRRLRRLSTRSPSASPSTKRRRVGRASVTAPSSDGFVVLDDKDASSTATGEWAHLYVHRCIRPGSIFEVAGDGHCGWRSLSIKLGYRSPMQLRDRVYASLGPHQHRLRAMVFPGGVPLVGAARDAFAADCLRYDECLMNDDMLRYIARLLQRRIVVVYTNDPRQSVTIEPNEVAGPPLGLINIAGDPGHFMPFRPVEDENLFPQSAPYEE